MKKRQYFKVIITIVLICSTVHAGDWSHWRGPSMDGSSEETNLPSSWSKTENVAWVVDLPGLGSATPIISGDKVFITSADKSNDDLLALCFDAKTGNQIWKKTVAESDRQAPRNNLATPSPVTDGKYVYFMFGSGDIAGFDLDGNLIWSRNIENDYGNISQKYGYSSSPLLFGNKLYVLVLRRDTSYRSPQGSNLESFLLALNAATGKEIWKQTRPAEVKDESLDSYTSPILFQNGQRTEILNIGASLITANDPETGNELWRYKYPENPRKKDMDRNITSLTTGEGLIFAIPPRGAMGLLAIKSSKEGVLSDEDIAWKFEGPAPDCSTPLFYKGNVYVLADRTRGVLTCLDAKTGKQKWQGELGGGDPWWASISGADDKLYCISESAEAVVLAAGGDEFKVISRIEMQDDPVQGSITIADGCLFIHTASKLYCITK
ncbi:MAG: PQQ-binding-like beta-propeller repeat protein [Sedimentisphaerales bacterium]|nr:PQQ-binding-like beta-propeller repeat protein [Sedimentisphaerales bacterium]